MAHPLLEEHSDLATAIHLLDKWIQRTKYKAHLPGLAIGLVHRGELLWGKGYGLANIVQGTPITLDTRFRIASITKTFTATAIMQLRDAGKLCLDDPVADYLDWFDLRYEGAPQITIRNLLTHTSGLPRDARGPMWTERKGVPPEEFIETTRKRQPTRAPYDKFAYSNLGFSLLGNIIKSVTGDSWADYVQLHILDPLGMKDTYVIPSADDPQLAVGYRMLGDEYERLPDKFFNMGGFAPSANIASTVNDLVTYARFHIKAQPAGVLSEHTLRDMHRVHWLYDKWDGGYGLGIMLFKVDDWKISGHTGGYAGYLTGFTVCHEHDFGVIVLTNALGSDPESYVERAYKMVLPEVIKVTAEEKPAPDPAWQQYLGTYTNDWGDVEVVIRDKQLQLVDVDFMDEPAVILEPTGEPHVFTIKAPEPEASNETARFEFNDAGEIVRLWERNEYYLRKT